MLNRVVNAISDLELGFTWAADFSDVLANPSAPVVSLVRGLKVSAKTQISREGKELAEQACPGMEALLRLFVGVDIALLCGFHEKHLEETIVEIEPKKGVKWFTLDDVRTRFEVMAQDSEMPEEVSTALKAFRSVSKSISGVEAISIKNLPLSTDGSDIVIRCNQFNPFPLLAYVLEPLSTLSPIAEETEE